MKFKLWVHLSMKKSFLIPLIIILVFAGIPATFWVISSRDSVDENVQGAHSGSTGVVLKIVSNGGAWDMFKYVCESREKCLESLESGKVDVTYVVWKSSLLLLNIHMKWNLKNF